MNAADRLAALREAATPGPWAVGRDGPGLSSERWIIPAAHAGRYEGGFSIDPVEMATRWAKLIASAEPVDASLIVALVNAAPALEALVRAAENVAGPCYPGFRDAIRTALAELSKALA
jgi:hypothetical protein